MKKERASNYLALFTKAGVLLVALVAVVMIIQQVRSPAFQQWLTEFFPSAPAWTWCPQRVQYLELMPGQKRIEGVDGQKALCVVAMEPVDADEVKKADFTVLLRAFGSEGAMVKLEGDPARGIFRVQGLPFRSQALEKALKAHSQP